MRAASNALGQRQTGFTLIELLVVIAVILILAALVNAAIVKAFQQAGRAHCGSNLRQWGQTLLLYAGQHHLQLPLASTTPGYFQVFYHNGTYRISEILIHQYHLSRDVWYCPVDTVWNDDYYWDPKNHSYGSATSYIYMGGTKSATHTYLAGAREFRRPVELKDASGTVLMADMVRFYGDTPNVVNHCAGYGSGGLYGYAAQGIRGGDLLFADGHVTWRHWNDMQMRTISPYGGSVLQLYW